MSATDSTSTKCSQSLDVNFLDLCNSIEIKKARIGNLKLEAERLKNQVAEVNSKLAQVNGDCSTIKEVVKRARETDEREEKCLSDMQEQIASDQLKANNEGKIIVPYYELREQICKDTEAELSKLRDQLRENFVYYRDSDIHPLITATMAKRDSLSLEVETANLELEKLNEKIAKLQSEHRNSDTSVETRALLRGYSIAKMSIKHRLHLLSELALDLETGIQILRENLNM